MTRNFGFLSWRLGVISGFFEEKLLKTSISSMDLKGDIYVRSGRKEPILTEFFHPQRERRESGETIRTSQPRAQGNSRY